MDHHKVGLSPAGANKICIATFQDTARTTIKETGFEKYSPLGVGSIATANYPKEVEKTTKVPSDQTDAQNLVVMQQEDLNVLLLNAVKTDMISFAELAIKSGADVNYVNADGMFPLYHAYISKQKAQMKLLTSHGADIGKKYNGKPILDHEMREQNPDREIIKMLINDTEDDSVLGNILLQWSRKNCTDDVLWLLSNFKVDINFKNEAGETAFMDAFMEDRIDMVMTLLEKGADPNIVNKNGRTALIECIYKQKHNLFAILISNEKVKINLQDSNGKTELHVACMYRTGAMINQLLQRGADVTIKNKNGETALDYCNLYLHELKWIFKNYEQKNPVMPAKQQIDNFCIMSPKIFRIPNKLPNMKLGTCGDFYQKYDDLFETWKDWKRVPTTPFKCEYVDQKIPFHLHFDGAKHIRVRFNFIVDENGTKNYYLYE